MRFNYYPQTQRPFYSTWSGASHHTIETAADPLATIEVPATNVSEALEQAWEMVQHFETSWYGTPRPGVQLHVRSAAIGDIFVGADNIAWVVESTGFAHYKGATVFTFQG